LTQRFAREAECPDVQPRRSESKRFRDDVFEPAAGTESTDYLTERRVDVSRLFRDERSDAIGGPRLELERELAMCIREERPREVTDRGCMSRHVTRR